MPLTVVRARPGEAADAVRRAWDRSEAVLVVDPEAPADEVARLHGAVRPDTDAAPEVAAVVVTSGTTGEPRGVELTWSGLVAMAEAVTTALEAEATSDRWLCCLPLQHVGGLAVVARSWVSGVPVEVLDRFEPGAVLAAAAEDRAGRRSTLVSLVPTMLRRLLQSGADLRPFRRILVGGGPLLDVLPPQATATYGMTETWGGIVHGGRPLAGTEVRLAAAGEVLLRGPTVMRCYRGAPERTAEVLDADGWLHTGDVGQLDAEGRLVVVDRLKDLIITGGVNVSPTEVERVLAEHPGVAEVCVTGAPDPVWGERVVAHVVPADASSPPDVDSLRAFAAGRLSAAKRPRQVVIVDEIPRTASGKPVRRRMATPSTPS